MRIRLGRGSVVVDDPTERILESLRQFRHLSDGSGEYEDMFSLSEDGKVLVTLPGFAKRILGLSDGAKIVDSRVPLPRPDVSAVSKALDPVWADAILLALDAGGGTISMPEMFGSARAAAAIIGAFPRDELMLRGAPLCVLAVKDRDVARESARIMRAMLPGRDIGVMSNRLYTDSDDIVVCTYSAMEFLPAKQVGILICDDIGHIDAERAKSISALRDAARWGILTTPAGGDQPLKADVEGLLGPCAAIVSYADAVKAGIAAGVKVCWLQAPQGRCRGIAPLKILEGLAIQDNKEFCELVAGIVRNVSSDRCCIVCAESPAASAAIAGLAGTPRMDRKVSAKERRVLAKDVLSGEVRKVVATYDEAPHGAPYEVVVVATCHGGDAIERMIPWRAARHPGDCSYIVDFSHDWDVQNGRPGMIRRNDEARQRCYAELGFGQMAIGDVHQLPF